MRVLAACAALGLLLAPGREARAAATPPRDDAFQASQDPLEGILHRLDRSLHIDETAGITLDYRYPLNPSETVRLSIVSQLLGYYELYKVRPTAVYRQDIVARADYLVDHFETALSHSAFDGMLGYSLLGAFEVTHDPRYFEKAAAIVDTNMKLNGFKITLNWGLMAAMGFAKYHALTGDPEVAQKIHEVIASLLTYQHADGSFAHYCTPSTDVHYTGWMSMELITIKKYFNDANIDPILARTTQFMLGRVDTTGVTRYRDPCSSCPGGWRNYYSLGTGCPQDYDTRGWINELGYSALLFDYARQGRYGDVMRFLRSLEKNGAFVDKWDYVPPTTDAVYRWATGDPSIIRMSVLFWSLASVYASRNTDMPADDPRDGQQVYGPVLAQTPGLAGGTTVEAEVVRRHGEDYYFTEPWLWRGTGPSGVDGTRRPWYTRLIDGDGLSVQVLRAGGGRGAVARFVIPHDGSATLTVFDVSGRKVCNLARGTFAAGEHRVAWDGLDARGRAVPGGVYLVRLESAGAERTAKAVLVP